MIGATDVTNTGTTTVNGEVGVSPGSSVTWPSTPPASGTLHVADTTAAAAVSDALSAFTGLMGLSFTTALTGQDLGTVGVLSPGVYSYSSAAQLTGTLTLDFGNVSNASFVFQIGSALTTAAASKVVVLNGDATDSVYFVVGSSATLGTATQFAGNILAWTSITMTTGAQLSCGRALALHGAVTLDSNLVSNDCSGGGDLGTSRSDFGSVGFSGVTVAGLPPAPALVAEPASAVLLGAGLASLLWAARRRIGSAVRA